MYTMMSAQDLRERIARYRRLLLVTSDARARDAIAYLAAEAEEQLRQLEPASSTHTLALRVTAADSQFGRR